MRKMLLALGLAVSVLPAAPALADPPHWAPAHGRRAHDHHHGHKRHSYERYAMYDDYGRYYEPRRLYRSDRIWRGDDGRYRCRRGNGTTGLIVGGAVGALLGRELDGGRDRTVGTVIGAAGGALLGRAIDRGELRCR